MAWVVERERRGLDMGHETGGELVEVGTGHGKGRPCASTCQTGIESNFYSPSVEGNGHGCVTDTRGLGRRKLTIRRFGRVLVRDTGHGIVTGTGSFYGGVKFLHGSCNG